MAKKPKSHTASNATPLNEPPANPFDRQAMEAILREMTDSGFDFEAGRIDPSLDQAQQLVYDAMESDSPQTRLKLARRALQISPDCADAYVLLSEQASSMQEALDLLIKGVAAGERAIGAEAFAQHAGHFWGLIETRPYMRARAGLILRLWTFGRREEAVEHAQEMLRLNPNDNQGMRYTLAAYLLQLNRDDDLRKLMAAFPDEDSANWHFNQAISEFRKSGDGKAAKQLLERACKTNPHVSSFLLGLVELPPELPPYYSPGDKSEAIFYAVDHLAIWKETPGAIGWLRKVLKAPLPTGPVSKAASWPRMKKNLVELPLVEDEVWQVDVRPFSANIEGATARTVPWVVLMTSPAEDAVVSVEMEPSRPDAKQIWEYLVGAMEHPKEGEPLRPARVEVRLKTFWTAWRKKLAEVGIDCVVCDELEHLDQVLAETIAPLLSQMPDADEDQQENFDPASLEQFSSQAWQADIRRLPVWVGDDGEPRRPWSALVTDRDNLVVLGQAMSTETPTADWLARTVLKAMRHPMFGEPHRPGVVQVNSHDYAEVLKTRLASTGVEVEVHSDLEGINELFADLSSQLATPDKVAPLLDVPGMTPKLAGDYFEAANEFYLRAPWRLIPGDEVIQVECTKFHSGPWYAVVMGQSAMTYGLAIYEGLDVLRATLQGRDSQSKVSRDTSALSLTYGEEFEIPIRDLEAIERHAWPVAAPEAFPFLMRVNPGLAVRTPLTWELELVTACLRGIPDFVRLRGRRPVTLSVPTVAGPLELTLSHVKV